MPSKTSGTIIKTDLAAAIQEAVPDQDLTRRDALDLVDTVIESMAERLEEGEDVLITGFGKWEVRSKMERPGRNPATGEPMVVSARKVVVFKPSRALRERMNEDG